EELLAVVDVAGIAVHVDQPGAGLRVRGGERRGVALVVGRRARAIGRCETAPRVEDPERVLAPAGDRQLQAAEAVEQRALAQAPERDRRAREAVAELTEDGMQPAQLLGLLERAEVRRAIPGGRPADRVLDVPVSFDDVSADDVAGLLVVEEVARPAAR